MSPRSTVICLNCEESRIALIIVPELPLGPAEGTQGRMAAAVPTAGDESQTLIGFWLIRQK
jgi:hypothetical protein